MIVNIGFLSEVCPHCGEVLWEEWGFWSHPEDFNWEIVSVEILQLLGDD